MLSLMNEFYELLATILNLQYGNILLATSTKAQLQTVIDNDWPFFINTSLVKTCLFNNDCVNLQSILEKLGNLFRRLVPLINQLIIFQMYQENCLSTQST